MQVDANGVPVPYKQTQKYKKSHARYMRYWRSVHESPHLRDWYGQRISSQPQPMVADISIIICPRYVCFFVDTDSILISKNVPTSSVLDCVYLQCMRPSSGI